MQRLDDRNRHQPGRGIADAVLLAAAGDEARCLLAEIEGSQGVWIIAADGEQLAHAGPAAANADQLSAVCASMTGLAGDLTACSSGGAMRSLVLETSTSRWIMRPLSRPGHHWIVVLRTDRMSMLAWALSRVALSNQRLGGE